MMRSLSYQEVNEVSGGVCSYYAQIWQAYQNVYQQAVQICGADPGSPECAGAIQWVQFYQAWLTWCEQQPG